MEIKTNYAINDTVYFLAENSVRVGAIPEEHREYMLEGGCRVYSADYDYLIDEADEEVGKIFIRKNGGEWHKPLIEEQNQNSLNSHNNEEI